MPSIIRIASLLSIVSFLAIPASSHKTPRNRLTHPQSPLSNNNLTSPHAPSLQTPLSTREYWMHQTFAALNTSGSPCPFYPFAAVVVNHTNSHAGNGHGELICTGVNRGRQTGNMMLHGEVAAILNCTKTLQDPRGKFGLTPAETIAAFAELSIYTNAESCPMCASAIRWNGFKEYIYGTSIDTLVELGFAQIAISSGEVFDAAQGLPSDTSFLGDVLTGETDALFAWQFDDMAECPWGCLRGAEGNCEAA
ncbi:cytidine deaminase-like protein [Aspergillus heterothallicus]